MAAEQPHEEGNQQLDDSNEDALVESIERQDSDIALQTAFAPPAQPPVKTSLRQSYLDHKKWTIPITVIVVLVIVIFALPASRYKLLGLVIKKNYTVTLMDSISHTPVSKASVRIGTKTVQSDALGQATFKSVAVGKAQVDISKQYYRSSQQKIFIGIRSGHNHHTQSIIATGRQVPIKIVNRISGQPLAGAELAALGSSVRTDKSGGAVIVLPADKPTAEAAVTADGYNKANAVIKITSNADAANTISLVPSGKVYFLSNASGKIDVLSTNYDGSQRQTVLGGTGNEQIGSTQLNVSPDQRYIALLARRSNATTTGGLYIINTANNAVRQLEDGSGAYVSSIGWSDSNFVYSLQKTSDQSQWQAGWSTLKSYHADSNQSSQLDQTAADGGSDIDYATQSFASVQLIDGTVVYVKDWNSTNSGRLQGKKNGIYSILAAGGTPKTLRELDIPVDASYGVSLQAARAGAHVVYFASPTTGSGDLQKGALYFKYNKGSFTQNSNFSLSDFSDPKLNNGYLATSPDGSKTVFQDMIDGHQVVSVGDQDGANEQKLVTLHGAGNTEGWLTNDYLLVAQDNSDLYVVAANPAYKAAQPLKVSSFLSPPQDGR